MSLGEQLRDARTAKNKSLEDISNETNITKKYLAALEENDFDSFPAQVYVIGFLKAYAKHVGLDPKAVLEEYNKLTMRDKLIEREVPEKTTQSVRSSEPVKPRNIRKRFIIPLIVAGIVIILATAGLLILYWLEWI